MSSREDALAGHGVGRELYREKQQVLSLTPHVYDRLSYRFELFLLLGIQIGAEQRGK